MFNYLQGKINCTHYSHNTTIPTPSLFLISKAKNNFFEDTIERDAHICGSEKINCKSTKALIVKQRTGKSIH